MTAGEMHLPGTKGFQFLLNGLHSAKMMDREERFVIVIKPVTVYRIHFHCLMVPKIRNRNRQTEILVANKEKAVRISDRNCHLITCTS